jgi:class 3 adenylate cyclase
MADERKLATVLFADLVGSTELGGSQDPERTRALLDRFYDAMTAEVKAAGGTIEKFAGDAVMAAFGAPAAQEDHAERALHAALSMQRRLDVLFDGALALRIGVNTGEVVVGRAREGSSFVTGDAVNVAKRLEEAAGAGHVLVGERAVSAVRGAFEFEEPVVVEAKGKAKGVAARRLVRALSLMRPRGVGGLHEAFVGRESELERLRNAYREAKQAGRPKLVTLLGDAGVGKTRLLREFWQILDDEQPTPLRRTGRCLSYGHGITYWPLGEVLKEHLGILESDSPDEVHARLRNREILGLTLGLDLEEDLHPLAARDRLHNAWIGFIESLTAERPVVLLVEDLHWAESPLLDLLERLARDVNGPLLLIGTARPDFVDYRAGWGLGRIDSDTIWLEPLDDGEVGRLVGQLLAHELPDTLRKRIVVTSEGNPFFVEEVIATLIDRGVIVRRNGTWEVSEDNADLSIPDSVRAVVAARIDLLDPAEKDALQAAAVIGRVFWTGPVYELLSSQPDLRVLEDRDFIRRRTSSSLESESEYAFKHALIREVAYGGLPKARRAHLHATFADWLGRFGGGRDEHAPLLAHHYAEAVRPEDVDLAWADEPAESERLRADAVRWLERAAELAVSRYEIDEALMLLHRALELESDELRLSTLWRKIGRANALKFDGEAFWRAMEASLATCDDRAVAADLYAELALQTVCPSVGDVAETARSRARQRLDRQGVRAVRAGERPAGEGSDRTLHLEPQGRSRDGAKSQRAG